MSSSSSSASETSTNTTEVAEIIDSNANTTTSTRKKSMVYTKTGDKGTTGLFNGERRYKDEVFFEALGTTDELNANIGMAREYCINIPEIVSKLDEIQSRLLDIGSAIATPKSSPASTQKRLEAVRFDEKHIETLEEWIDALDAQLPPLTNFILPSGGIASSQLHIARTVCRRAERQIVSLEREGHVDIAVLKYMNRLSDFLFVAARYAAKAAGKEEVVYKKSLGVIKRQ